MDYYELECAIETWAEERGIFEHGTTFRQACKTQEELNELFTAIKDKNYPEIIDAIGDIMVTLIIQAKMQNVTIEHCLESAYNVISKRTGRMINGTFVRDK